MSVLGSYQGCLSNVIIKVNQKGFAKANIRLGNELHETDASSNQVVLDDKNENSIFAKSLEWKLNQLSQEC